MGSLKTTPISFLADFLDEKSFISIKHNSLAEKKEKETAKERFKNVEFEFLSSNLASETMLTADELFFEGKLLPFRQMNRCEKINKVSPKADQQTEIRMNDGNKEETKMSWFLDDDPSPRPPKCSVLWKELLRLRRKRGSSTLSPSLSTSSSTSSSSCSSFRIRPIINVPVCTQGKNSSIHFPQFCLKKGRLIER